MLIHPIFDPIAIHLGPIAIRWYGLMYLLGFLMFLGLARLRLKQTHIANEGWQLEDVEKLLIYGVIGVILGGRLGYVIFYQPSFYFVHPLDIFKVWQGGLSFHGGFIGVIIAMVIFSYQRGCSWIQVTDFIAPMVPPGLGAGRIGNFINGELWGRVSSPNLPWAMGFPQAQFEDNEWLFTHSQHAATQGLLPLFNQYGMLPRHPSQLYEFIFEGCVLFVILWLFSRKARPMGAVSALFLLFYGLFRFLIEFTRAPDNFLGLLALSLSMGQWLSLPMVLLGLLILMVVYRNAAKKIA